MTKEEIIKLYEEIKILKQKWWKATREKMKELDMHFKDCKCESDGWYHHENWMEYPSDDHVIKVCKKCFGTYD